MKISLFQILIPVVMVTAISILATNCKKEDSCDTTNVSYKDDIAPLLQSKGCLASGCHSSADAFPYHNYAGLKVAVDFQRLVGSVKQEAGFSKMPKNGTKLDDCSISLIEAWVTQGAKDN